MPEVCINLQDEMALLETVVARPLSATALPVSVTQVRPSKKNIVQRCAPLSVIHDSERVQDMTDPKILSCHLGTAVPPFSRPIKQEMVQHETHSALPVSRDTQIPRH